MQLNQKILRICHLWTSLFKNQTSEQELNGDKNQRLPGTGQDVPNIKQISPRVLSDTLHSFTVTPFQNESANSSQLEKQVFDVLADAHHPSIGLWIYNLRHNFLCLLLSQGT